MLCAHERPPWTSARLRGWGNLSGAGVGSGQELFAQQLAGDDQTHDVDGTLSADGVGADAPDAHLNRAFFGVGHRAEPVGDLVHDLEADQRRAHFCHGRRQSCHGV